MREILFRGKSVNMEQEYLNDKEHEDYMNDISSVVGELIGKVIFVADKHNVDRNNAIQHFSQLFSATVQISTFEHFGEGGTENA